MKKVFIQFFQFMGISGIGWCIDFSLYIVFTSCFQWQVFFSNCLSAVPAVTLVFLVSTSRIFRKTPGKIPVYAKYAIYLLYQLFLLLAVSLLGQWLAAEIVFRAGNTGVAASLSKVVAKVVITPVTMAMNFLVMKLLTEKI